MSVNLLREWTPRASCRMHGRGEHRGLSHLTLREEPISDPTLIQHLDRTRVKTAGPRADKHVIGPPLENRDVDLRTAVYNEGVTSAPSVSRLTSAWRLAS